MLSNFTVVNILQCKYIYQTVIIYLQYTSFLFVSCTSVKLEKKIMDWIEVYTKQVFLCGDVLTEHIILFFSALVLA